MVREIERRESFLTLPSEPCTPEDLPLAQDLKDTLSFHSHECVGMAANMIGVSKSAIIAQLDDGSFLVLFNPEIISSAGPYETEEGCLSLKGKRKTLRYREITVSFMNERFRPKVRDFAGFEAEIIQHELDHLKGIII